MENEPLKPITNAINSVLNIGSLFELGKTIYDIYKDNNENLCKLFLKAIDEALYNVSANHYEASIKDFLECCIGSNSLYEVENLFDYLCKINRDNGNKLSGLDLKQLDQEINEQLNIVILTGKYESIYTILFYQQFRTQKMN